MRQLSEKQAEFLSDAIDILDKRESDPEAPFWLLDGSDEEVCFDCLEKIKGSEIDWREDHGELFEAYGKFGESDSPRVCRECRKLLSYTLTDFGVSEDLAGYEDGGFDWNEPDSCFAVARVAHGIFENPDQQRRLINILLKGENFPKELKRIRPSKAAADQLRESKGEALLASAGFKAVRH